MNRQHLISVLTVPVFALLVFGLAGCTDTPTKPVSISRGDYLSARDNLRRLIVKRMKAQDIVGLSIAVLDDQQVIWAEGFGYADKASKTAATAHTIYRAGSISKVFTATAVMQLAETGKIDIDAPLVNALPTFSIRSRDTDVAPITPRMIMTHHAGLPTDYSEGMWTDHPTRFTTLVAALHDEYRTSPPNLVHAYSNVGFTLLGAAIEQVADVPYENHMRDQLLLPMRMNDSAFTTSAPPTTQAYDTKGEPAHEPALRDIPAGGLNSTAPDLLQFARMWFANGKLDDTRVLSPASLADMRCPQNAASPLDADLKVGLGWHFADHLVPGSGPVLIHNGATINHRAVLVLLPDIRLAVAVMSNSANAEEAETEISSTALELFRQAKTGIAFTATTPPGQCYPAAAQSEFPGDYASELGFMTVSESDARLRVNIGGKSLALKQRQNGYLGLEYRLLGLLPIELGKLGQLEFTRAHIGGHEVLLASDTGTFFLAGEKIAPTPIPDAWTKRLGIYEYAGNEAFSADLIAKVEIRLNIERGFLLAELRGENGTQRLALDAIANDQAILRGLGRGRGETIHVRPSPDGELLYYSGFTFKRKRAQ